MHSPSERIAIEIVYLATSGEGVGFINNKPCFVRGVIPGEVVEIVILKNTAKRYVGKLERVLQPHEGRVTPPCKYFGICGGCQLQHIAYGHQVALKSILIQDALRSIAKIDRDVTVKEASGDFFYRNRGQYPVANIGHQIASGFYQARSHTLVPIDTCPLHDRLVDTAVSIVRTWANEHNISVYSEKNHHGWLRHIVVRASMATRQVLVTLVGNGKHTVDFESLVQQLTDEIPSVVGIVCNGNHKKTNVILGKQNRTVWGESFIQEILLGVHFNLSTNSFFQVNPVQAQYLFERVFTMLGNEPGYVVDAFCGAGAMAAILGKRGYHVLGIEIEPAAIKDAQETCSKNNIDSVQFKQGAVEEILPVLIKDGLQPHSIILDPPRKGCALQTIETIVQAKIPKIVYVSCNPGTLARDLKLCMEQGYILKEIEGVDMFPQTTHVESVSLLELS